MELCADKKRIFLATPDVRSDLGESLERAFVALLRHVVHPDGGGIVRGHVQVRLIDVQTDRGHVVKVLGDEPIRIQLGLLLSYDPKVGDMDS